MQETINVIQLSEYLQPNLSDIRLDKEKAELFAVAAEAFARTLFGLPFIRASLEGGVVGTDMAEFISFPVSSWSEHELTLKELVARCAPIVALECCDAAEWQADIADDDMSLLAAGLTYSVGDACDIDGAELRAWLQVARARAETMWEGYFEEIARLAEALEAGPLSAPECRKIARR